MELQNDNIEENKLFYKKVLNSAFEKEKLRVGGEGGVSIKKNMGERDRKCNNTIPFNALDQLSLKYFTCNCVWGRVQAISEIPPPSNIKPTLTNIFFVTTPTQPQHNLNLTQLSWV